MKRALLALAALVCLAAPAGAVGAPRWYVATDRAAGGGATVSGYAVDGTTQVMDDLELSVERGGVAVAGDSGHAFVQLSALSLVAGDTLVLTDTTTSVVRTTTFTGLPTLVAPACDAASFGGVRAAGTSVSVSSPGVAAVTVSGPGASLASAFSAPLAAGATVKASAMRAVDATFTVFDSVSAVVGACPAPEVPAPTVPTPPPAATASPAVPAAPAAVALPAPAPVDTLAPAGKTTLPARTSAALYRALRAGTFASSVSVSEPATIRQTLALGTTTLATTSRTATRAGAFSITFKLSATALRRLAAARTARLTLKTTLRDAAGNARALPSRTLVARR